MQLPDQEAVDQKACEMGLADEKGHVRPHNRAAVVNAILATNQPAEGKPKGTLLSRSVVKVADGQIIVEVIHVPN